MTKGLSAFTNSFKIPELRKRIIFTLLMIIIIRLGAVVTLPGVAQDLVAYKVAIGHRRDFLSTVSCATDLCAHGVFSIVARIMHVRSG